MSSYFEKHTMLLDWLSQHTDSLNFLAEEINRDSELRAIADKAEFFEWVHAGKHVESHFGWQIAEYSR